MTITAALEPEVNVRALTKTEKVMTRAMLTAWQAPMFDIVVEIDMQHALDQRRSGVTVTDVILGACAAVLVRFPGMNALYRDDAVHEYTQANVGLAVASDRGLTVPVIHGADKLSLNEIAEARRQLVGKVRDGKIAVSDVVGGTFTVSNLGMFDVKQFTAIINPPQVGILAVGSTRMCNVWNDGAPEWRQISEFTLTCDHRAVDGALAARFMSALKATLEGRDTTEN
jgi:pyruvate dehydrogenase E2 component (dihydrolipoamide acetyltransferase)